MFCKNKIRYNIDVEYYNSILFLMYPIFYTLQLVYRNDIVWRKYTAYIKRQVTSSIFFYRHLKLYKNILNVIIHILDVDGEMVYLYWSNMLSLHYLEQKQSENECLDHEIYIQTIQKALTNLTHFYEKMEGRKIRILKFIDHYSIKLYASSSNQYCFLYTLTSII